ncbi:hypothetical protein BD779DRAFT_1449924, partial [Infundibulicybe gibba]
MTRRLEGRKTILTFDDYRSEPFNVENGLDQGDPFSLICYVIYNSGILDIPEKNGGETGLLYVDDAAIIATGKDFKETHHKLKKMMTR